MVQRPVMETNSVRNPTAAISGPPPSDSLLDGKKTGATLLVSGLFLILVGAIFTTMAWQRKLVSPTFEWLQRLGPILICAGGTFMLASICRLWIIPCLPCRQRVEETPVMEQIPTCHSFTLSGVNQPVVLCGATTVLYIPPVYDFVNQEVRQPIELQPGGAVNGIHGVLIPPHDSGYCVLNTAFTSEEEDRRRSR